MGAAKSTVAKPPPPPPEDLFEFKKGTKFSDDVIIPEPSEYRVPTDKLYLKLFFGFQLITCICMTYTVIYSDADRLYNGHDECGNVCGKKNPVIESIPCSGLNNIKKPFLAYLNGSRVCTDICENFEDFDDDTPLCIRKEQHWGAFRGLGGYLVAMTFISFVVCFLMLVVFRYAVGCVVWFTLGGTILVMLIVSIYCFQDTSDEKGSKNSGGIVAGIIMLIITVIAAYCLWLSYKRVNLVIQVFEEAVRAIFAMPIIFVKSIIGFTVLLLILILFCHMQLIISTAGTLQKGVYSDTYEYVPDGLMSFTVFLHIITTLWGLLFLLGIQDMVIAGAVSAWYFARDKSALVQPVKTSVKNAFKFHLGSVAFGSITILLMMLLKIIVKAVFKNRFLKHLVGFFLQGVITIMEYFTKNAYIQIAMHGQPFLKSGKRGFSVLFSNTLNMATLKFVGGYVLFMVKLFIIVVMMIFEFLFAEDTAQGLNGVILAVIFTSIIVQCVFTFVSTGSDTIFMCFCEDRILNDGIARPYFMSSELMKFNEDILAAFPPPPPYSEVDMTQQNIEAGMTKTELGQGMVNHAVEV